MEYKTRSTEELARFFINQLPQKSIRKNIRMKNQQNLSTLRDSIFNSKSESSISTKSVSQINEDNSIEINSELIKSKMLSLKFFPIKIPHKFDIVDEKECEFDDFSDLNENIALIKGSCSSIDNQCIIESSFPYFLLMDINHFYNELIKDFNNNQMNNMAYKQRIALVYMKLILEDHYPLKNVFISHCEINTFLLEELCLFLIVLYLDEFNPEKLSENELLNFKTCLSYSYINFKFVVMLILENADVNGNVNVNDKVNYVKCKMLIENNNGVDYKKLQFHSQNKIMKNVLNNLLSNLNEINSDICGFILGILVNSVIKKNAKSVYDELRKSKQIENKLHYIEQMQKLNQNEEEEEDLPKPSVPFLNPKRVNDNRKYTLVLDLDETLVHFFDEENEENAYVKVRMGTEAFIASLSKYFELVIFTASTKYYADIVVAGLDPNQLIEHRLYREHTDITDGFNLKDISKLGRDLTKTIIIDNIEDNYMLQPLNGLNISSFEGDKNDSELHYLLNDLLEIPKKGIEDVRDYLPFIRKKMKARYFKCN